MLIIIKAMGLLLLMSLAGGVILWLFLDVLRKKKKEKSEDGRWKKDKIKKLEGAMCGN